MTANCGTFGQHDADRVAQLESSGTDEPRHPGGLLIEGGVGRRVTADP
jgi:hypothetical protein